MVDTAPSLAGLPPAIEDPAMAPPVVLEPVDAAGPGGFPAAREGWLEAFRRHVYGRAPEDGWRLTAQIDRCAAAGGGLVWREEITVDLATDRGSRSWRILVHRPALPGPVPVLLGLNFAGNHTTTPDPWPTITPAWVPPRPDEGSPGGAARSADRGILARRWPYADLVAAGFAVATVYSGEIEPDRPDGWRDGIRCLFPDADPDRAPADAWGTLAVWAFGLRRSLDALLAAAPWADPARLAVVGHSRMGKSALWAAAQDPRIAGVLANDSGCTGAAIARRRMGERQVHLNARFPHWCCRAYRAFDEREDALPVDQHQLLACIAPRIVHVASADQDRWADPDGELLACVHAGPAWDLLGAPGFGPRPDPVPLDRAIGGRIRYHRRPGPHDLTATDWHRFSATLRDHGW
jgi:hypothetical protein